MYISSPVIFFLNVSLLPVTKVLGQYYKLQKDLLEKIKERIFVSDFPILAHNWFKITVRTKNVFLADLVKQNE